MKIQYQDKTFLQKNEDIAETNKVTDDNLNEIKEVVNSNDDQVTKNASATVSFKILWEGTLPLSESMQQIEVSDLMTNYDLLIFCRNGLTNSSIIDPKSDPLMIEHVRPSWSGDEAFVGNAYQVTDTDTLNPKIGNVKGFVITNNNTIYQNNGTGYGPLTKIIGLKFGINLNS